MNENLIARRQLLVQAIAEREPNIEELKNEFNLHTQEINRLEYELAMHKKAAPKAEFYFIKMQKRQLEDQAQLDEVNRQINEIPTIACHEKTNPVFKDFAKAVVIILIFLLPVTITFAQPLISMEAGSRLGINAGYIFNNNVIVKGGAMIPYTRRADVSNVTYADAGYSIRITEFNLTPLIGISHYHVSDFSKGNEMIVDKTVLIKSLELGRDFTTAADHYGNYYLFISQAYKTFFGAGLRVFIK